ncbi:DNA lyase [Infirmifilum lucidum]|uniref:DNA lyase n=1 Tax=Infirmifilum lucidum TaxID=2776706 RepID=A0A7L9FFV3_9CREN|nr:DNA lyase [Infirmifilum lucidum]QOJ78619.1 DNA lyase [Infirmifilum lucidum]
MTSSLPMQAYVELEDRGIDLRLTLYPSFVLSLLQETGDGYVKIAGRSRGCVLRQTGGLVVSSCGEELTSYLSGLWYRDVFERASVKRSMSRVIDTLRLVYSPLSLSVDPLDPLHVFVAVFLSQTTNYHANVLSWTRRLWFQTNDPFEAATLASRVFSSFQVKRLPQAIECLPQVFNGDRYEVRRQLVQCPYVGPKTADAFLLYALADPTSPPVDRHFVTMASKLGMFAGLHPPRKEYCSKYRCEDCPLRDKCIRWRATRDLGELAGWVQTVFYVHDKTYCSRRLCDRCPLRSGCSDAYP